MPEGLPSVDAETLRQRGKQLAAVILMAETIKAEFEFTPEPLQYPRLPETSKRANAN